MLLTLIFLNKFYFYTLLDLPESCSYGAEGLLILIPASDFFDQQFTSCGAITIIDSMLLTKTHSVYCLIFLPNVLLCLRVLYIGYYSTCINHVYLGSFYLEWLPRHPLLCITLTVSGILFRYFVKFPQLGFV